MKNKILFVIFILFLAGGAGYYIWKDFSVKNRAFDNIEQTEQGSQGTCAMDIDGIAEDEDCDDEEAGEIHDTEDVEAGNTAIPNLDREIIIITDLPDETKKIAQEKIEEMAAKLKENQDLYSHWLELASYYKLIGDYAGAREVWEYMNVKWSQDNIASYNLGNLFGYYLKNFSKAEKYFLDSLVKKPDYIPGYVALHEFYKDAYKEKADLADDILLEGLKKNPNNVNLLIYLAAHYRDTGDTENAREYYKLAISEVQKAGDADLESRLNQDLQNLEL